MNQIKNKKKYIKNRQMRDKEIVKDGASFCYCAYVLRISGYSSFLRNLPPNTTIFLRGL